MTTTDIPDRLPMGAVRLMGSWFNKLLDAVRRRTIIEGRGIRATSTPNGVIISCTSTSKSASVADDTVKPWDMRFVDVGDSKLRLDVYIPQGNKGLSFVPVEFNGSPWGYVEIILNPYIGDGWYAVGETTTAHLEDIFNYGWTSGVFAQAFVGGGKYAIAFEGGDGVGSFTSAVTTGYEILNGYCIGKLVEEDGGYGVITTSRISSFTVNQMEVPFATEIAMSSGDASTVYAVVNGIKERMPSGGGALAELSDDIPLSDTQEGSAGSSTGAARADHQHPLQVDDSKPPEPIPVWNIDPSLATGGEVGSSTGYARADHVHPFPPIVANEDAQDEEGEEWYLDMMPDGEGGSVTGASPSDPPVEIGSVGSSERASPIDHSHPLNVTTDTSVPKEIIDDDLYSGTGSVEEECLGKSRAYARADHTHVISGVPWLANNPDLPTGATDGVEMMPDEDSASGSFGDGTLAAPIDHRHPMNLNPLDTWMGASGATGESGGGDVADGCIFPIGGTSAFFGISPHYCREDHRHPLPTDGTGANGIVGAKPYETADSQSISAGATPSGYGNGYNATWSRDANFATGGTGAGFKMSVVNKIAYNPSIGYFVAYFRTLTFDAYGLCKNVSAVKCAQISGS